MTFEPFYTRNERHKSINPQNSECSSRNKRRKDSYRRMTNITIIPASKCQSGTDGRHGASTPLSLQHKMSFLAKQYAHFISDTISKNSCVN
ncbi:hypothetical protein EYC84_000542 [Monilinia fructicola]|uniref:Uncharacterized protein n=1 Tax=Monilinia fructicola TaxID=38448 RepID=A0A5M9JTM1_MONFR|nr:hypothetical protein EYC84_000542 [Monilinia fructicola]